MGAARLGYQPCVRCNGRVANIPEADVEITPGLVASLIAEQCPQYAGLPLTPFAHGWDNESFRLGAGLLVRLPRRRVAVPLLVNEQRWLPVLGEGLGVPLPVPVFAGRPSPAFDRPWSVVPHLEGRPMAAVPREARRRAAAPLARAFAALHRPADPGAPRNPFRGGPLSERAAATEARLAATPGFGEAALSRWRRWSAAPAYQGPPLWLHGDPHPLNLLVGEDGGLAAILDWGDLTAGDPACDLATAWLCFDATGRAAFRDAATSPHYDGDVWTRARAWALHLAAIFVAHCDDMPVLGVIGEEARATLLGVPPVRK